MNNTNNAILTLISALLQERDGYLKEIAPGITVFYQERKSRESMMTFYVAWDSARWRLGAKNPETCFLKMDFQHFSFLVTASPKGKDLVGFLRNCLVPLSEDSAFYAEPKNLRLQDVSVYTPDPNTIG